MKDNDILAITLYALLVLLGLMALAWSGDFDDPEPEHYDNEPIEICGNTAPTP